MLRGRVVKKKMTLGDDGFPGAVSTHFYYYYFIFFLSLVLVQFLFYFIILLRVFLNDSSLSLDPAANYKCEVKRIYSCLLPDQIAKCTSFPAIILSQKANLTVCTLCVNILTGK